MGLANKQEQNIIDTFIGLINSEHYTKEDYHREFVVRYPDILAENGELPPILRECFKAIEAYYRDYLTPMMREYLNNHSKKEALIYDGDNYSETALNYS